MKYIPQFMNKMERPSNKTIAVDNERKVLYLMGETCVEVGPVEGGVISVY